MRAQSSFDSSRSLRSSSASCARPLARSIAHWYVRIINYNFACCCSSSLDPSCAHNHHSIRLALSALFTRRSYVRISSYNFACCCAASSSLYRSCAHNHHSIRVAVVARSFTRSYVRIINYSACCCRCSRSLDHARTIIIRFVSLVA